MNEDHRHDDDGMPRHANIGRTGSLMFWYAFVPLRHTPQEMGKRMTELSEQGWEDRGIIQPLPVIPESPILGGHRAIPAAYIMLRRIRVIGEEAPPSVDA